MRDYKWAVLLLCCGLAMTAQARPRIVPDQLTAITDVAQGQVRLAKTGEAVLAGIVVTDGGAVQTHLQKLSAVDIKSLGTDRYGRQRILLFAPAAPEPVQVALLRQGLVLAYDQNALPSSWRAAEAEARTAKRGVWATQPLAADAVKPEVGRFVRVAGKVTRVYKARDAYYVNFGEDWKTDFSIAIPRRVWRGFGTALDVAPGSWVEARGALVAENGPMLILSRPEQWQATHAHP